MSKNRQITVQGRAVTVVAGADEDYISLTDIARHKNAEHTDDLIRNWLLTHRAQEH